LSFKETLEIKINAITVDLQQRWKSSPILYV